MIVADTLFSSVDVLAALVWLKKLDLAIHWLEEYTAPFRAKPDSRPYLEGASYKYSTSCSHLVNPAFPTRHAHTSHTPTNSLPLTGLLYGLSAEVQSRLDVCLQ